MRRKENQIGLSWWQHPEKIAHTNPGAWGAIADCLQVPVPVPEIFGSWVPGVTGVAFGAWSMRRSFPGGAKSPSM